MGAFDGIRIPYDKGYPTTGFKREYDYFKTQPAFQFFNGFGMPELKALFAKAEQEDDPVVWVPHHRSGGGHIGLSTWYVSALIKEYDK